MNKITKAWINSRIASVGYASIPNTTVTLCNIRLVNGFSVNGESACVDPASFNVTKGTELAYQDAYRKIWALEGYLLAEGLWLDKEYPVIQDFGWALIKLKQGLKVARQGWNGKGMWLSLSGPSPYRPVPADAFWSKNNANYARSNPGSIANVLPCITMKTADGSILMGWLASQTDMLAEDWTLVD